MPVARKWSFPVFTSDRHWLSINGYGMFLLTRCAAQPHFSKLRWEEKNNAADNSSIASKGWGRSSARRATCPRVEPTPGVSRAEPGLWFCALGGDLNLFSTLTNTLYFVYLFIETSSNHISFYGQKVKSLDLILASVARRCSSTEGKRDGLKPISERCHLSPLTSAEGEYSAPLALSLSLTPVDMSYPQLLPVKFIDNLSQKDYHPFLIFGSRGLREEEVVPCCYGSFLLICFVRGAAGQVAGATRPELRGRQTRLKRAQNPQRAQVEGHSSFWPEDKPAKRGDGVIAQPHDASVCTALCTLLLWLVCPQMNQQVPLESKESVTDQLVLETSTRGSSCDCYESASDLRSTGRAAGAAVLNLGALMGGPPVTAVTGEITATSLCLRCLLIPLCVQRARERDVFIRVFVQHLCARSHSGCRGTDGSTDQQQLGQYYQFEHLPRCETTAALFVFQHECHFNEMDIAKTEDNLSGACYENAVAVNCQCRLPFLHLISPPRDPHIATSTQGNVHCSFSNYPAGWEVLGPKGANLREQRALLSQSPPHGYKVCQSPEGQLLFSCPPWQRKPRTFR
ncbi:hypothetical protein EYF80_001605 [Liparis tanakae]|uniref:Uncharacterized protein n=1 Tax=Liparis tanakae TaxID=230148 RepID=A0A4Z2JDW2_9TELE|nr:hypothetical protein EYF80_001605 [Liparis tanakae]